MFRLWLNQLARRLFPHYRRGRRRPWLILSSRPRVEPFEARLLPSTFTVLNTNDSGAGSLRQAILDSNGVEGGNTITFAIAPSGVQTINLLSPLPAVSRAVVIDGTTEPGYAGAPLVVLNGAGAGGGAVGLTIAAGNSTVQGLVIDNFGGDGIDLTTSGGDVVRGNYIGTDATGTAVAANDGNGVTVSTSANTVGGTTAAARNVISGNAGDGVHVTGSGTTGNVVEGNSVGTDVNGNTLISGTVAWYKGEGNANDAVFGNTGTPQGGVTFAAGEVGQAFSFNGVNSSVVAPNSGNLQPQTVSVALWVNSASPGARAYLLSKGASGDAFGSYALDNASSTAGELYFDVDVQGVGLVRSPAAPPATVFDGHWHLVVGTYDGQAVRLYVDGVQQGTGTPSSGGITYGLPTQNNLVIGNYDNGGASTANYHFNGLLDEITIYDRPLSAAEVQGIFTAGSAGQPNPLGNQGNGITITGGATGNTVGGTAAGAGNLISGQYRPNMAGVLVGGPGDTTTTGNRIVGNLIGADATGAHAEGNQYGVWLEASGNTVGGTTAAARNVISGNDQAGVLIDGTSAVPASNNLVEGNYVGTDPSGSSAVPNFFAGIETDLTTGNTIGGLTGTPGSGPGNLISGNSAATGVELFGSGDVVEGNLIGTNAAATAAVPDSTGILIEGANNTIGGISAQARNVVSGNVNGLAIATAGATGNVIANNYIGTTPDGSAALPNTVYGFIVEGSANNTFGLPGAGNVVSASGYFDIILSGADHLLLQGNIIDLNAAGTASLGVNNGVELGSSSFVTIGGTAAGAGNVFAGGGSLGLYGGSNDLIQGNFFGTNATGTVGLGGGNLALVEISNSTVGGTAAGAGNVISGNSSYGLLVEGYQSTGNLIQGNKIGTNAAGSAAIQNVGPGLWITQSAAGNTVAGNVLSGNANDGAFVDGTGLPDGNLAWFKADGDANNSGNGPGITAGTINGGVSFGPGKSGKAFQFHNSAAESVVVGDLYGYGRNTAVTVEGWINLNSLPPASGPGYAVADKSVSATSENYGLYVGNDAGTPSLVFEWYNGGFQRVHVDVPGLTPGSYHHVAVTTDGTTINFYLDGAPVGSAAQTSALLAVAGNLEIGASPLGNTFDGLIDDLAVYSRALTAADVQRVYNAGGGSKGPSGTANIVLTGNLIGTNAAGAAALPNGGNGVTINNSFGNTVGGATAAARNVIGGNTGDGVFLTAAGASGNVLAGNYVGTNAAGTAKLPNAQSGVVIDAGASNTTIGGLTAVPGTGAGNVISGNGQSGAFLDLTAGSGTVIQGNLIGLNAAGNGPLGNATAGIKFNAGYGTLIGGTTPPARNVISANLTGISASASGTNYGLVIQGNYVGTDVTGSVAENGGGSGVGIGSAPGTVLGGTAPGAGNLISGNNVGVIISGITHPVIGGLYNSAVQGNVIGLNAAGTAALANGIGVSVLNAGNLIGGTSAAARNVISGNTGNGVQLNGAAASANLVAGNYVGTDPSGTSAVGNHVGVAIFNGAMANTVGGPSAAYRNVISGQVGSGAGVGITNANGNFVYGNYVGTTADGTAALGNNSAGIALTGAANNQIGGPGAGNIVSGNTGYGIEVVNAASTGNNIQNNLIGTNAAGSAALANGVGVYLTQAGGGNLIAANVVSGNTGSGIQVSSGAGGNTIAGNYIGTDLTGSVAVPNVTQGGSGGVYIQGSPNNTIGGTTPAARNVISGNADRGVILELASSTGNVVEGNSIGTDVGGTAALGNSTDGVRLQAGAANNTVGGPTPAARNVISGNGAYGVQITGGGTTGNVVAGNYVGTDKNGTAALGNAQQGVGIQSADGNAVTGNVVSANGVNGIFVHLSDNTLIQGNDLGTNAAGTAGLGNGGRGIYVQGDPTFTVTGTVITGNLVSANGLGATRASGVRLDFDAGSLIQGNRIGTDATGAHPLGNGVDGLRLGASVNDTVGGTVAGAGNVISGNTLYGLDLNGATGTVVQGNDIGTDPGGAVALPNGSGGVVIDSGLVSSAGAVGNTVGGTAAGAGNVISGNGGDGVHITGSGVAGNVVAGNYIGTNPDGTAAVANVNGVEITGASGNTVGGTAAGARNVISGNTNRAGDSVGVSLDGGASGNVVAGNFIGLNAAGSAALANTYGVYVSGGAQGNTLGGTTAAARNVISGNLSYGLVILSIGTTANTAEGNYFGTDLTGSDALSNGNAQVLLNASNGNLIGGAAAGAGNLISGGAPANADGVWFVNGASGNTVQGNRIGTNAAGTAALGNAAGVAIDAGSPNNLIGGTAAGAGNVISGNTVAGVEVFRGGSNANLIQGNFIGTDVHGTAALGNVIGVEISAGAAGNTVGGTAAGARNLISGNTGYYGGVEIDSAATGNVVAGNYVGTDVTGTLSLGNPIGVYVTSTGNTVGGAAAGAGNVIAGNDGTLDHFQSGSQVVISQTNANDRPNDNVVAGNLIGLGATGHAIPGATDAGVFINFGVGNTVGGLSAAARNVISGNLGGVSITGGSANLVEGNYIGTDPAGTSAISNGTGVGVDNTTANTIGGTTAAARNVISGNTNSLGGGIGVWVLNAGSSGNVVEGNFIGTDATGTAPLPNDGGLYLTDTSGGNTVGGLAAVPGTGAGNLIADSVHNQGINLYREFHGDVIAGNAVVGNAVGILANGDAGIQIGGAIAQGANQISGNGLGVWLEGSVNSLVQGNLIGTSADGTAAQGNSVGVQIDTGSTNNTVGGTTAAARNVISGSGGNGVLLSGSTTTSNVVAGNFIGTNSAGTNLGNHGAGVLLDQGAANNSVGGPSAGMGNTIAFNAGAGVAVTGSATTGDPVRGNSIHDNAGLGIDLGTSPNAGNNNEPAPTLTAFTPGLPTVVSGTFGGSAGVTFTLDVYANPAADPSGFGQGRAYLGSQLVTTGAGGAFTATLSGSSLPSQVLSATATDPGDTSEFSRDLAFSSFNDTPPQVSISGPANALAGIATSLSSTVSGSTAGKTYTYAWGVTQPGNAAFTLPAGTVTTQPNLIFTPPTPGTYVAALTVMDNFGATGSAPPFTLTVGVPGPGVVIKGAPGSPVSPGATVGLTSVVAEPAGATPVSYAWSVSTNNGQPYALPPGTVTSHPAFSFAPAAAGVYQVSLTVVDSAGAVGSNSVFVVAAGTTSTPLPAPPVLVNVPPTATVTSAPASALAGQTVSLTGTVSAGATARWSVTFNGQPYALPAGTVTNGPSFTFPLTLSGAYAVTLTATNTAGQGSAVATIRANPAVVGVALTPVHAPFEGPAAARVVANVTGSVQGVNYSFAWSVSPAASFSATQLSPSSSAFTLTAPTQPGSYTVRVTVTGSDGSSGGPTSQVISVAAPLTAAITQPGGAVTSGPLGIPVNYAAQVSGGAGGVSYSWSVTLNGTPYPLPANTAIHSPTFSFTPGQFGTYAVQLTASDGAGGSATAPASFAAVPTIVYNGAAAGANSTFTVSLTTGAPTAGSFTYQWAVNGQPVQQSSSPDVSVTLNAGTQYSVTLTVLDSGSNTVGTASQALDLAPAGATIDASGMTTPVLLVAAGGHNKLIGGTGPSVLVGDTGNNTLIGGSGPDTLIGTGSDTLTGGTGPSNLFQITQITGEQVTAGTRNNTLSFAGVTTGVSVSLVGNTSTGSASAPGGTVSLSGTFQALIGGATGNNNLSVTSGSSITLFGGGGNDSLSSSGGSSVSLVGGSGNETLSSSGGSSITMFGGTGNDSLLSFGGNSISLVAGSGNDTLSSTGGSSITMFGGAGNDSLQSSGGSTITMISGNGNDTLSSTGGASVTMFGGSGNDSLNSSGGSSVTMVGGSGNETLSSSGGSSITMFGGSGNDSLISSGGSTISMVSGGGNDTLSSTGGTSVTMFGGSNSDSLSSSGGTGITMVGGSGNETLSASGGSSITMFGGSGSDSLNSSGGSTISMVSGNGNDTLSSSGGTSITMFGGSGNDSLNSSGGSSVTMVGGSGNETLSSSGGASITMFGGSGNDTLSSTGGSSVSMVAGGGNDTLSSTNGSSVTMFGGGGNDSLQSSGGSSVTMVAGGGNDTLSSTGGTGVAQQAGSGNDTLSSTGGSSITMFGGSGNDSLNSSGGSSISIVGGSGNETLSSSGGSSITMFGGSGNDSLSSSGGSTVTMVAGSGNDTLSSTGGSSITMFGGSGNDTVSATGGTGVTIVGGSGNDSLSSSGGSGVIIAAGSQVPSATSLTASLAGATYTLTAVVSGNPPAGGTPTGSVTFFDATANLDLGSMPLTSGRATLATSAASAGDRITAAYGGDGNFATSGAAQTLGAGLTTTVLTSSAANGSVTFRAAVSAGAGGTPTGSVDFVDATTGQDLGGVSLAGGSATSAAVAAASVAGHRITATYAPSTTSFAASSASQTLIGNSTLSSAGDTSITLFGGSGNDTLTSSGGSGVALVGGSGNDTLSSQGGNGVLLQGSVLVVTQSGGTSVTMFGASGNDSLRSSGGSSVTLIGGSGNDTLSSSGGTSVTMFGGTGTDSLSSSGGSTVTMIGGSGNDTLTSTNGTSVTLFGGTGNDSLASTGGTNVSVHGGSGNDSIGANDTLSSSGGSSITLFGGTGNDSLASTGGTNVSMVGGTGNDTLSNSGGSSVTLFGGTGNDSLSSSGGSSVTMVGGTGNDTLTSTGGTSVTMFGGTGNDSLASSGGSTVSMTGGSGNDTLSASGDGSATLQAGGGGNDALASSGGSSITLFGGSGNDSLSATGGSGIVLAGLQGNNTYAVTGSAANPVSVTLNDLATFGQQSPQDDGLTLGVNTIVFPNVSSGITLDLSNASAGAAPTAAQAQAVAPGITVTLVGQFQNVVGTPGNDFIKGDASSNVLSGGGGNDTLAGGSGPATLVAGSGNDSLVAGSGGTTFQFAGSQFGSDVIDPPAGAGTNRLDFSQFGGPVILNLASTAAQTVSSGAARLTLTLQNPAEINALADSPYNDAITGNAAGDAFTVGAGNDTFTGGGGADTFFFGGSQLGSDVINETTTANTLNFYGFDGPINLNLKQAGTQTVSPGAASRLTLTLPNPSAFNAVIGSTFGGTIVGNDDAGETIVGGAGLDSLVAGGGNDTLQANVSQVVYLAFPSAAATPPGAHVYTADEESAVLAGLQRIYADFNYAFTLSQATAQQQAQVTGGQYATILFDGPVEGGAAFELDLDNHDLGGLATVNVTAFLGDPSAGLVAPTSANIIGLSTTIAAHELGHLSGLQHQDAFGPIGSGLFSGVNPSKFSPAFPGPQGAAETAQDIMSSPDSVGTTLQNAAAPTNLGERDAIKLAFNDTGTVLLQANLPTQQAVPQGTNPVPPGAVVLQSYDEAGTIYQVGTPQPLAVPNPLPADTRDAGKTFSVSAAAVNASIAPGQVQYFAISGTAGQVMTFQIISATDTLNPSPILPALEVLDATGKVLPYYGDTTNGAFNIHEFESGDSTLLDVTLPTTGTYYVGVLDQLSAPVGYYQLFAYSFAAGTGPSTGLGDTLVGGGGNDLLIGSSGNTQFAFAPGSAGHATLLGGSGQDFLTLAPSPAEQVMTSYANLTITPGIILTAGGTYTGQPIPATATVTGINGVSPGTATLTYYAGTSASGTPLSGPPTALGTYTVVATFAGGGPYTSARAQTTFSITLGPTGGASVFVLSPSAAGALTVSGSSQIKVAGSVDVDSKSSSAISVSGTSQITAGSVQVVGNVQVGSSAHVSPSPVTGASPFADPLLNLPAPSASTYGLTFQGSVNVSGSSSLTISPGIYSQISVSRSGRLTLNPGIYVIAGGGLSVTGSASVSGSGVLIYNAGSNYLGSGNSFGVVNLSGGGSISLTPPTSGPYAGILIFQSRDNTNTVALSGSGIAIPGGVIYAPAGALSINNSGQFQGSVVVNTLTVSGNAIAQLTAGDGGTAYAPAQVRTAYGINNLSLDGTGQTIAVVAAYDNPTISQALDTFDAQFALTPSGPTLDQLYGPAASFLTVLNEHGQAAPLPATDPAGAGNDNWEVEAALDVEWAHAVAPGAKLVLVEADSQSLADLMTGVAAAAQLPGVSVVSMSWGFVEGQDAFAQDEAAYDPYFTTPAGHTGVTFVASSGDYGGGVMEYPAASPDVAAVGGTSLTLNADDSYKGEVGWGYYANSRGLFVGSGGGLSRYEAEPAYQQGVQSTGSRTTPDVALLADPATGAWVADPYNLPAADPWEVVGGTSLSAPAWAGLLALADQGRAAAGKAPLGSAGPTEAQTALYGLSQADYHAVTAGGTGYSAGAGYNLVTGLGTPLADRLVPDLVASAGGPPSATPVAPITAAGLVLNGGNTGGGTVDALVQAALLRGFTAQVVAAPDTGAAPGMGDGIEPSPAVARAAVSWSIAGTAKPKGGNPSESPAGASGASSSLAPLIEPAPLADPVPAHVTGGLQPETPTDGDGLDGSQDIPAPRADRDDDQPAP